MLVARVHYYTQGPPTHRYLPPFELRAQENGDRSMLTMLTEAEKPLIMLGLNTEARSYARFLSDHFPSSCRLNKQLNDLLVAWCPLHPRTTFGEALAAFVRTGKLDKNTPVTELFNDWPFGDMSVVEMISGTALVYPLKNEPLITLCIGNNEIDMPALHSENFLFEGIKTGYEMETGKFFVDMFVQIPIQIPSNEEPTVAVPEPVPEPLLEPVPEPVALINNSSSNDHAIEPAIDEKTWLADRELHGPEGLGPKTMEILPLFSDDENTVNVGFKVWLKEKPDETYTALKKLFDPLRSPNVRFDFSPMFGGGKRNKRCYVFCKDFSESDWKDFLPVLAYNREKHKVPMRALAFHLVAKKANHAVVPSEYLGTVVTAGSAFDNYVRTELPRSKTWKSLGPEGRERPIREKEEEEELPPETPPVNNTRKRPNPFDALRAVTKQRALVLACDTE